MYSMDRSAPIQTWIPETSTSQTLDSCFEGKDGPLSSHAAGFLELRPPLCKPPISPKPEAPEHQELCSDEVAAILRLLAPRFSRFGHYSTCLRSQLYFGESTLQHLDETWTEIPVEWYEHALPMRDIESWGVWEI